MDNELYSAIDLVRSKEWMNIKQLLVIYADALLGQAVNLGGEEIYDRKRVTLIGAGKYFKDFIRQVESGAEAEKIKSENKDSLNRETVPSF